MRIQDIDHIELYVGDPEATASQLCEDFGFRISGRGGPETGLTDQRSLLLRQGEIQILVTAGLVADHPATEYIERHGDGVAVLGLLVEDIAGVIDQAVAGGATVISPVTEHTGSGATVLVAMVSGFGDVVHRLVQRPAQTSQFLPGVIDMLDADSENESDLLRQIDHLAVCLPVGELHPTVQFYRTAFGFDEIFEEYIEVGEQGMESKVVQNPSGGVTLTLIQPDPSYQPGQIDDFLTWHGGAGVQHVAYRTEDIVTAVRTFESRGVQFAPTPDSYYEHLEQRLGPVDAPIADLHELGVLVDRDHWGQMFQIFTRSTHPRRTLFLEFIERKGARTFGSGNIKALYEAKERELAGLQQAGEGGAGMAYGRGH